MLHQCLARPSIARNNVDHARRQLRLHANFRKRQRRQRRKLRRLQHHRISRRQRRSNLPRQHQQRKIPRNNLPHHSARHILGKLRLQNLRPTRVIIKMPRHQRNIDVPALANRLAVIHRFQHRQPPRVLLHQPRQRIQIFRPRMRSQRLPLRRSRPRRFHRGIDIPRRSLRHRRQPLAIRRIDRLKIFPVRRRRPRAANKMRKPPPMRVQPRRNFFRIFRRRPVFHAHKFFSNAHIFYSSVNGHPKILQ